MNSIDRRAITAARRTRGLTTDATLTSAGISDRTIRRRIANDTWRRVRPGVVDITSEPFDWHRRVTAAVLGAPDGARASHATAAALHGLGGIRAPHPIEVTVARTHRGVQLPGALTHTAVHLDEPVLVRGVPTTPVARTLRDLAVVVSDHVLSIAVTDALRRSVPATELAATASTDDPGAARLRRALGAAREAAAMESDSGFEDDVVTRLLADPRVPPFRTQARTRGASGRRHRIDVVWDDQLVGIDVQGSRWHSHAVARKRDPDRRGDLESAGWWMKSIVPGDLARDRWAGWVAELLDVLSARTEAWTIAGGR